jgi:hypothetical protein
MRITKIYKNIDTIDYIKCRIDNDYIINDGIILEQGYNIIGFILYHTDIKDNNKILNIDYLHSENETSFNILLKKFINKLKYEKYHMILSTMNLDTDLINRYINLNFKIFCFKDNNKCILYKIINSKD